MKRCTKCGSKGPFGTRNKGSRDGLASWCKECLKAARDDWRKTLNGQIGTLWIGIRSRAENKNGKNPTYKDVKLLMTREEFKEWVRPKLKHWLEAHPDIRPSIDRKSDEGHYEISNLQLISLAENTRKARKNKNVNAPKGMSWCSQHKAYLPVEEFSKNKSKSNGLDGMCKFHWRLKRLAQKKKKYS